MKKTLINIAKKIFYTSYNFGFEKIIEKIRFLGYSKIPPALFIEPTNNCNLNCVMCTRHLLTRKKGFMPMDLYKKIINDAAKLKIEYIRLNRFGESLLNPKLFEMIKYAKSKGLKKVGFSSNGTLLTKEKAKEMVESGIDYVNFSIDSLKPELYEKIRRGAKLKTVLENVLYLLKLREKYNKKFFISVSAIDMNHTHEEVEHIKKFWKEKGVNKVIIQNLVPHKDFDERINKKETQKHSCEEIFNKMIIHIDGDCIPCCSDDNALLKIGNVKNKSIKEIWNGPEAKRIRKIHLNHEFKKLPLCNKCYIIKRDIIDFVPPKCFLDKIFNLIK